MGLDIKNKIAATGCLLIHGFGGNTDEVRPLADYLLDLGYKVECPSLKGHTGKRKDLKTCNYMDWILSAKESYYKLRPECENLFIVGFSMGGLIAFQIALESRVDAIITLNTPIYYWDVKRIVINIVNDFKQWKFDNVKRYVNSSRRLPLKAMFNFRLFLSRTKPLLNGISCPVFSAQALKDDTVRKTSANYINNHISSKKKELIFYGESGHCILWSEEADNVIKDVADFMNQILG